MATTKKKPAAPPLKRKGTTREEDLLSFSRRKMQKYAIEVIMDRAIPDVMDGLKPVQRRVMWATSKNPAGQYIKTARVVGDTLGRYHPHGDTSVQDAIKTMVTDHSTPMLDGKGNWGNLIDNAAAMRYTNMRLSAYGRAFFHPDYINDEVTTFVPNYDDREVEPVVLPAPLPNIIINGAEGIAVGAATKLPSFTPLSVIEIVERLLKGEKLKPADFAGTLKPQFRWGGQLVKSAPNKANWLLLFKSHKARILYEAPIGIDTAKKHIIISEWPPGIKPDAVLNAIRGYMKGGKEIKGMPEAARIWNSKGSMTFTISTKPGYTAAQFDVFCKKVQKLLTSAVSYNMNVTASTATVVDGVTIFDSKLYPMSVPKMLITWLRGRMEFEAKSLAYRMRKQEAAIAYTNLIIYATTILDVIRKAWEAPDFIAYIVKHSKLNEDQARVLGSFKIQSLSKLDQRDWKAKLKDQQDHMAQLKKWAAKPRAKVLADIQAIKAELLKPKRKASDDEIKLV